MSKIETITVGNETYELPNKTFTGTHIAWNALTTEQKAQYDFVVFNDDYDDIISDSTIVNNTTWSSNKINSELVARDELGAKNLLPNVFVDRTYIGVTATPNNDGTFTVNGTFESIDAILVTNTWFESDVAWIKSYEGKSVKLSGGVQNCVIAIRFNDSSGNEIGFIQTNYDGSESNATIIPSGIAMYAIYIYPSGTITLNNALFKPMLRLASITDDTYVPYARTNQELTGEVEPMLNLLGAKNLLPNRATSQTINGVTFIVNSDGSITANGTATAETELIVGRVYLEQNKKYIVSGCPKGGSGAPTYLLQLVDYGASWGVNCIGSPVEFTFTPSSNEVIARILIGNGVTVSNLIFYPMIRLASISDDTYVPYAETNLQLTQNKLSQSDYAKTGAVNYLENKASTLTVNGITFTVNSDKSVTANGTATDTAEITLNGGSGIAILPAKNYRLRGCPSGGSEGGYRLFVKLMDNTYIVDTGERATIPATSAVTYVRIVIYSGKTVNNLTFYPMITETDYTGPYAPYAKTNAELTSDTTATEEAFTANTSIVSSSSALKLYRIGKLLTFNGYIITNNGVGSQNDTILTLTNARPVSGAVTYVQLLDSSGNLYLAKLNSNGTITLDSASLPKAGYSVIGTVLIS